MNRSRFLASTALAVGLAAALPAPSSAQVGRLIKKAKEKVEQTAGSDTAAAPGAASGAAQGTGPVFTAYVLEITPELLDRLAVGLAVEAAKREENARRVGNVLPEEEYTRCKDAAIIGPEGQRLGEESMQLIQGATSDQDLQRKMEEMGKKMEAFIESKCGLEPFKAEQLSQELAPLPAAAAQEAAGLNDVQWSILKERILPLCSVPEAAEELVSGAQIPTEKSTIFYVYTPAEVEALRPRCGALVQALQTGV